MRVQNFPYYTAPSPAFVDPYEVDGLTAPLSSKSFFFPRRGEMGRGGNSGSNSESDFGDDKQQVCIRIVLP